MTGESGNVMQADSFNMKRKTGRGLRWVAETIVGLIYPPRCPICDRVTAPECVPCRKVMPENCGSLLRSRCASAAANRWMASGRNSAWTAESAGMRTARGKPCLCIREISGSPCTGLNMQTGANMQCSYYAGRQQRFIQDWVFKNQIEVIVPVPMYRWKKRRRGYNQAETFARALGRELGLPVDAGLVRRVRNTVPQKELNGGQRAANFKKMLFN